MNQIVINGKVFGSNYNAGSISIIDNQVYVNGKLVDETDLSTLKQPVEIVITGDVMSLESPGAITVNGNVAGDVKTMGAVAITGDVGGNIETMGAVRANNVKGKIDTMGKVTVNSRG